MQLLLQQVKESEIAAPSDPDTSSAVSRQLDELKGIFVRIFSINFLCSNTNFIDQISEREALQAQFVQELVRSRNSIV